MDCPPGFARTGIDVIDQAPSSSMTQEGLSFARRVLVRVTH